MAQKTLTIILGLILVGGLAWYINKNYLAPQGSNSKFPVPFGTSETVNGALSGNTEQPREKLIFTQSSPGFSIYQWQEGKGKKLFTDTDEKLKITKLSNIASASGRVLVIFTPESQESAGELYSISLSNAQKESLRQNFIAPNMWALSPDGEKIAQVRFSNLEENYGYSIYVEEKGGGKARKLFLSQTEIFAIAWDGSSSKLAFSYFENENTLVKTIDVNLGTMEDIITFEKKVIDSLVWQGSAKLFLSLREMTTDNEGEIGQIKLGDNNYQKITDFYGGRVFDLSLSLDQKNLGYLVAKEQASDGQIYILNIENLAKISVQKGSQVLGWLP